MAVYKTPQRTEEVSSISEILRATFKKFSVDIDILGEAYGVRTSVIHCIAGGLDDIEKVQKLISNIEYAIGRHNVLITHSPINQFAFDIAVPFEDEPLHPEWKESTPAQSELSVPLGVAVSGERLELNLETAQHILMAGSTGSGKSTLMHSIICSLIRKHTPERLKFALIDPKRVELTLYANLPHLMVPVILNSEPAAAMFTQLKNEMDARLGTDPASITQLPRIVAIVDEFSDFMCSDYASSIEENIIALTTHGHTVGIHLILSTSRPSTNIYTDAIRRAFPSRIIGCMGSATDAITMLGARGGERLLGKGDMFLRTPEHEAVVRFQALHISEDDVKESNKKYGGD